MIKGFLYCLISTVMLNNFNILNASSINENSSENKQHNEITNNNTQNNKQYWDEVLPTVKYDAKETLKKRFDRCTNWIIELLNSGDLLYKIRSFNRYKYAININSINDIMNMKNLTNEIEIRKNLLNDINNKEYLNGNAWSEIPLQIFGYGDDYIRNVGQYLQWNCELLDNHWNMTFKNNYDNVKLNFYASYEYQTPKLYNEKTLNSEEALSVCLSAIEMDLLTSENITGNIELFANYLVSRKDNNAKSEISRYRKYFNDKQNKLLEKHIISHYLSFPKHKGMNVAKYLTTDYILMDLTLHMKANQFLKCINKRKVNDWFDIVLNNYLDSKFGTNYNQDYLDSFKKIILADKTYFNNTLVPKFHKYVIVVFRKLVEKNNKIIHSDENYKSNKYNTSIKILTALNGAVAGYQSGSKTIENIMSYIDFKQENKLNKKKKKHLHV